MYVHRNGQGVIDSIAANPQVGWSVEVLADNDPTVVAFLNPPAPTVDQVEQNCKDALTDDLPRGINWLKLFKAKMISDEAYRLGKAPGALTNGEKAAIRDRIAAIYKAL